VVQVLEGESTQAHLCSSIGRSVLRDLPLGLPQGTPVDVTFEYGSNGRLHVRARVPGTNHRVVIELQRERGLDDQRLHRWKQVLAGNENGELDLAQMLAQALEMAPAADAAVGATFLGPTGLASPILIQGNANAKLAATTAMATPTNPPESHGGEVQMAARTGFDETPSAQRPQGSRRAGSHASSTAQSRGRRRMRTIIFLIGHVVASTMGLLLGYIILCKIRPNADFLGWFK
jgi:hypothetical protein